MHQEERLDRQAGPLQVDLVAVGIATGGQWIGGIRWPWNVPLTGAYLNR